MMKKKSVHSNNSSSPSTSKSFGGVKQSIALILTTALITSMCSALGARLVSRGSWWFHYMSGEYFWTIAIQENGHGLKGVQITVRQMPNSAENVAKLESDGDGLAFAPIKPGQILLRAVVCKGPNEALEYKNLVEIEKLPSSKVLHIPNDFHQLDPAPCASAQTMRIKDLAVTSQKPYSQARFDENSDAYIDRGSYSFTDIPPALRGQTYIITANEDKCAQSDSGFSLRFDVNTPVTVFIAHDDRYKTKPAWMAGFEKISTGINLSALGDKYRFNLYRKDFPEGTITLGANVYSTCQKEGSFAMYSVVIAPQSDRVLATH
jgi:hypothetical protein